MDDIVYVCNICGETFALEDGYTLYTDIGKETLCPNCRSSDIEEGKRCKVCREIRYAHQMHGDVCNECFADAVAAYKSCLSSLMPWEKAVLEDEYGNIDITERD